MLASMSFRSLGSARSRRSHARAPRCTCRQTRPGANLRLAASSAYGSNQLEQAERRVELLGGPFELAQHPQQQHRAGRQEQVVLVDDGGQALDQRANIDAADALLRVLGDELA